MADDKQNIIIVKKKKGGGDGHHGGAWKVAYADFVTAMMALFIVLWVLNQNEEVQKAVANYFRNPTGYSPMGKNVVVGGKTGVLGFTEEDMRRKIEEEQERFEELSEDIKGVLDKNEAYLDLNEQIKFEIVQEGLRIELLESSDNIFFGVGSSNLHPKSSRLIESIGTQLSKIKNKIVIEGHTDSRPFAVEDKNYTNYELSADRANSARRALIRGGVKDKQIDEIRGYADKRLRDPENPYSVVNRRISIVIKYLE